MTPPVLRYAPAGERRQILSPELLASVGPVLFLVAFAVCAFLTPKDTAGMAILLALCVVGPILVLTLLFWSVARARQARKPVPLLRCLVMTVPLALLWVFALQIYAAHRGEIDMMHRIVQQQQLQSGPSQQAQPNP